MEWTVGTCTHSQCHQFAETGDQKRWDTAGELLGLRVSGLTSNEEEEIVKLHANYRTVNYQPVWKTIYLFLKE